MKLWTRFYPLTLLALWGCAGSNPPPVQEDGSAMDVATQHQINEEHRKGNDNIGTGPLGGSGNPVKVGGAEGVAQYLEGIRGPKGQKLSARLEGDQGIGPFGSLMYLYTVQYNTPTGPVETQVFFDYDFEGFHEPLPIQGFRKK